MGRVAAHERVEAVYRSDHDRLWRSLVAFTHDRQIASDAEAEAFAQVMRRGDDVLDVRAWVWRAAFKIAAGMLAARTGTTVLATEPVADDPRLIEFLDQLQGLTPQQRQIVSLRYVGNFGAVEIADLIGTSAGTVRVQLHRAHSTLRSRLEEDRHG
jgi:RNA polymerase sigma-70 factor (ECF subfamily)